MSAIDLIEQARRYARHDDYNVTRDLITRLADEVERLRLPALAAGSRERFEADYLAAFPVSVALQPSLFDKDSDGDYKVVKTCAAFGVWQQQAARHEKEVAELVAALKESRRAIGDHYAPDDCYATGPMTGNDYRDLIECPACSAIKMQEAAIEKYEVES